jgi:hypothetical protein
MAGMVNLCYVPNMTCQTILLFLPLQMCTAQRFMFSGMQCCVVEREVADISKDHGVYIFRIKGVFLEYLSLKMKALWSISTKGTTRTTHTITSHMVWIFRNTVLHWIGMFANKKIYFCTHYRPDVEAFISCFFYALPFADVVMVFLLSHQCELRQKWKVNDYIFVL